MKQETKRVEVICRDGSPKLVYESLNWLRNNQDTADDLLHCRTGSPEKT